MSEYREVPCVWCLAPTTHVTCMCDRCWDLSNRIRKDLDLTRKILLVEHDIQTVKVRT